MATPSSMIHVFLLGIPDATVFCPHFTDCSWIQERIVEQIMDIPLPQIMEKMMEVVRIIPQEHVQNRTVEQIVDVSTDRGLAHAPDSG